MWSDQKVQPLDEVLGQYGGILQVNRVTVEHLIAERDEARAIARQLASAALNWSGVGCDCAIIRDVTHPECAACEVRGALAAFNALSWAKESAA